MYPKTEKILYKNSQGILPEGESNHPEEYFENFFDPICQYIIQKIREEDIFQASYDLPLNEENLTQTKHNCDEIRILAKKEITELILKNRDILINCEDFYEEECQLSLLNWAMDAEKQLRERKERFTEEIRKNEENKKLNIFNEDFFNKQILNNNEEILLFNIIKIFQLFPIKPEDLKNLNFIEKLKQIKKQLKKINPMLYKQIKILIKYWTKVVEFFSDQKNQQKENNFLTRQEPKNNLMLERKTKIKENLKNEELEVSISFSETMASGEQSVIKESLKKKSVSWKDDDLLVETIFFNPEETVCMLVSGNKED